MRLTTFSVTDGARHAGAVLGDEIADLSAADGGPPDLRTLLEQPDWATELPPLLQRAPRVPTDTATLHAPIPAPSSFTAIGLNSHDHRREVNARWLIREPKLILLGAGYLLAHPKPKHPFFFAKASSSIIGPGEPIVIPPGARKVDWEGELAVVIGAPVHEADVQTSQRSIAGYLICNDISVRDWQTDNPTSAAMAKSYPSHGPLGPWLSTPDEVDVADMELRTYLNGQLRQRGRIADLILSPAEIISRLSMFCLLRPGDVIACGTFSGTGWPSGQFLTPGDSVQVEIDGIGELVNPVISTACD